MRRFLTRRSALAIIASLVVAFVAFEVGVRLLQPDAVQYTIQTVNPNGPGSTISGTITDPATIARWRAAMTERPRMSLKDSYIARWQGVGCSVGTFSVATYRFTWHELPVEVVSPGPSCAGGYAISSGGIPDWSTYFIDPLPQP
ncbi:MAG TPA: hypothetical protein VFQ25_06160 [Ktedonobacterales bacterium]|nr:hypothetical protein [Ktedonobacterales bacterium]